MQDSGRARRLAALVASSDRLADLLPEFHREALSATGGTATVLLRLTPRTGEFRADSAAGASPLRDTRWLADPEGHRSAGRAFAARTPVVARGLPDVATRLNAPLAMLAPLGVGERRLGLLLVAVSDEARARASQADLEMIASFLSIALERGHWQHEALVHRDLRELAANLSMASSWALELGASLEIFCERAARLFSATRVSVWLHDRRARVLNLSASSHGAEAAPASRISTEDLQIPLAAAMRRSEALVIPTPDHEGVDVLAPLRGRRRALGTLEFHGVRLHSGDGVDLVERVDEVARQMSAAIENVWLLEEVLRSRRELESTFNSLTDLVVVADGTLRVTQANRAFANRVGRQPEDLAAHPLAEFFGRDVLGWIERTGIDAQTIAPGNESREIADEKLNGTFIFTLSPLLGRIEQRIGTVIVARDVTAQARLEAERAQLRNRLAQTEKLAALGQFVAGIAHELNNPLQGVLGHVELMLHEGGAATRFRRELKLVFREAERAAKIVHNLLVFAGSRRIARRRLNANNVVEKVLALRTPACAAASITIVKELAPKLPRIAGDALLLQQAILNIVLNAEQAILAAPPPRQLEVRTRAVTRHRIEIEIADSGPGISPDALSRLFEPFFTTKEVGQGTGLGLAIAYGVVQEHGGQLHASNRVQGGAVFTMALPASFAEAVE